MRLPSLLVAGAIALTGTLATATAAEAADTWRVPARAAIVIKGHGYGHGHGMSQYGAEGAARQGRSYQQIMRFYYPGTHWGTRGGRVRVLISADTTDDLVVRARRTLVVRDTAHRGRIRLPHNGARLWRVSVAGNGTNVVSYRTRRWHRWRTLDGQGEFGARGRPVRLVTPSGDAAYRGLLRAAATSARGRATVNIVSLESYLRGVVPLEMPALWHQQAVRAQAVAARTYASYERDHAHTRAYQLCDTTACQVYGGFDAEHPAANRAIAATAHRIRTFRGGPAFTQFSSSSGGWTAAGSMPYLRAKRDPYDGWPGNPVHSWRVRVRDTAIERAWPRLGNLRRITVNRRDGNGQWGGRVESITLRGGRGRVTVSGDTFRSVLGLRSTWVTFAVRRR